MFAFLTFAFLTFAFLFAFLSAVLCPALFGEPRVTLNVAQQVVEASASTKLRLATG
jgi:hypothetical protein